MQYTPLTDSLGNSLTLHDPASAAALNDFVEGFIACEARAVNVLNAAADTSAIVQACCAALHMFAESADAPRNARPFIQRALASAAEASEREQRFVAAVAAWVDGNVPRAIALHEEQARLHPRDLASLKLGQYHLFNRGDSPGMLRIALQAAPASADVPYLHGMLAFGWEQCHLLDRAEASARQAIALCRKEPWAHHALAHVMLTQGRIREGTDFMASVSDTWTGLNSFMVTHNWWHQALFLLEQDRHAEVLALYDQQVWGVVKEYTQDQIGAVSLLARLELSGVDVGNRWADVADHLERQRLADHVLPFLDLQYLYGLARAGRTASARTLQNNIAAHAATRTEGHERTVWQQVCVPAAHGLLAHAEGDWATAVQQLGVALPRLVEIGGSHAQRDLFHQIWLDALQRNGQWAAVQNVLQPMVNAQPESVRLARQVGVVQEMLGLPLGDRTNAPGRHAGPSMTFPVSQDMAVDFLQSAQHESLVDLLCELHAYYNQPPTATRDEVGAHLRDNLLREGSGLRLLVATDTHGTVLGFAALMLMYSLVEPGPGQRRQCLLKELYVRAPARGRGVGEALVRRAARFALDNGCGRMDWNVKASNLRGIAFYEAMGALRVEDRLSFRLPLAQLSQLGQPPR